MSDASQESSTDQRDSLAPQTIAEMTPAQQRLLLSRRAMPAAEAFVEIGGPNTIARRFMRMLGWSLLLLGVAAGFVLAFWKFTNSLRIALVIVAGMLIYMYAASKLAEGKLDERN